jgi:excisionase family DNA binding protein
MATRNLIQSIERHIRVEEFANRSGYSIPTIRKKISRREIAYRKVGRIITIPESELVRLLGELHEPISFDGKSA